MANSPRWDGYVVLTEMRCGQGEEQKLFGDRKNRNNKGKLARDGRNRKEDYARWTKSCNGLDAKNRLKVRRGWMEEMNLKHVKVKLVLFNVNPHYASRVTNQPYRSYLQYPIQSYKYKMQSLRLMFKTATIKESL